MSKIKYPKKMQDMIDRKKRKEHRKTLLGLVMAVGIMSIAYNTTKEA